MADKKQTGSDSGLRLVIPFFVVLGVMTVVSFLIPLRPTRSQMEKRELAKFPEFCWTALADGTYFDEITTWFSDTFPGREGWLALSAEIESLHGSSDIAIAGDLPVMETIPEIPQIPDQPQPPEVPAASAPDDLEPAETTQEPTEKAWGGVDAGDDAAVEMGNGAVIQIGDAAFNAVGFSQICSDRYAEALSGFADALLEDGIRVVSAPAPTAVGILVEPSYLEKLNCADQNATIRYMHSKMNDHVVKVDTYAALVAHNDEYVYFRTDHHWTARGAYYAYEAICQALEMEPLALEEFREWDQGEFEGSLYWKASNPRKLKLDTLIAYVPPYDITLHIGKVGFGRDGDLIQDMTNRERNAKYSAFICSDNALSIITNNDLPEGRSCMLIKDSFGNCLAPYLACNYHKVYVIDYRKFSETTLRWFIHENGVDDVIFAPYVIATQAMDGTAMIAGLCK